MNPLLANSTVKNADAVNNGNSSASFTFAKPAAPPKVHTHALRTLTECTGVFNASVLEQSTLIKGWRSF